MARLFIEDGVFKTIDAEAVIDDVIAMRERQRGRNRGLYDLARRLASQEE